MKKIVVVHKYLEKGHTQMECDAMHSTIERKLRNREIYTPGCYVDLFKTARLTPKPYEVLYLDHTFWKKISNFNFYSSIRPGNQSGDPTVHDLRCIKYNPDLSLEYKVDYKMPWTLLPRRCNKSKIGAIPSPLYNGPLKIKLQKYNHLQELKSVIPKDFHTFYDNLLTC